MESVGRIKNALDIKGEAVGVKYTDESPAYHYRPKNCKRRISPNPPYISMMYLGYLPNQRAGRNLRTDILAAPAMNPPTSIGNNGWNDKKAIVQTPYFCIHLCISL